MSQQASASAGSPAVHPNRGVKRGLPNVGLPVAESSATMLWSIARLGMTSKEAFAKQLGWNKASGNHWDTRLALLRGFKLVKVEGDQIGLSELGQKLVNDSNSESQRDARRTALLNLKAYQELVDSFNGTALPDLSALASRLRFDYGKSAEFAEKAAQAFVDSLRHANMVDASNIVRKDGAGEPPAPASGAVESQPTDDEDDELDRAFEAADDGSAREEVSDDATDTAGGLPADSNIPGNVSISATLDLSRYRADEVIEILRALRGLR